MGVVGGESKRGRSAASTPTSGSPKPQRVPRGSEKGKGMEVDRGEGGSGSGPNPSTSVGEALAYLTKKMEEMEEKAESHRGEEREAKKDLSKAMSGLSEKVETMGVSLEEMKDSTKKTNEAISRNTKKINDLRESVANVVEDCRNLQGENERINRRLQKGAEEDEKLSKEIGGISENLIKGLQDANPDFLASIMDKLNPQAGRNDERMAEMEQKYEKAIKNATQSAKIAAMTSTFNRNDFERSSKSFIVAGLDIGDMRRDGEGQDAAISRIFGDETGKKLRDLVEEANRMFEASPGRNGRGRPAYDLFTCSSMEAATEAKMSLIKAMQKAKERNGDMASKIEVQDYFYGTLQKMKVEVIEKGKALKEACSFISFYKVRLDQTYGVLLQVSVLKEMANPDNVKWADVSPQTLPEDIKDIKDLSFKKKRPGQASSFQPRGPFVPIVPQPRGSASRGGARGGGARGGNGGGRGGGRGRGGGATHGPPLPSTDSGMMGPPAPPGPPGFGGNTGTPRQERVREGGEGPAAAAVRRRIEKSRRTSMTDESEGEMRMGARWEADSQGVGESEREEEMEGVESGAEGSRVYWEDEVAREEDEEGSEERGDGDEGWEDVVRKRRHPRSGPQSPSKQQQPPHKKDKHANPGGNCE